MAHKETGPRTHGESAGPSSGQVIGQSKRRPGGSQAVATLLPEITYQLAAGDQVPLHVLADRARELLDLRADPGLDSILSTNGSGLRDAIREELGRRAHWICQRRGPGGSIRRERRWPPWPVVGIVEADVRSCRRWRKRAIALARQQDAVRARRSPPAKTVGRAS